jgi:lipopolysaccharide transport system ATP-binding protein
MAKGVIRAGSVYKKFRRGETYDSLRDLIPALARRGLDPSGLNLAEKEFWALRDVSFEVARGEAFGVIGNNGAGKSTLLKHLCGIMRPTKGTLEVEGRVSALIEIGAGFHEDLTGRENVYLNGTILGMSRSEIRRKFDSIVDFSGLEEFIDTPVKRYSSGMYARLGFAVAAHVEPDVLIVDEVLSVGDYVFQRKGLEKMRAILGGGATVVFVSHNLHAVANLCQRTMLMEHGSPVLIGPTSEVVRAYIERGSASRSRHPETEALVTRVTVRDEAGESLRFTSGQRVWIEVEGQACRRCEKLAVVIDCVDEEQYEVFNTSTERLGETPLTLEEGESFAVTFEVKLNLVPGTFQLGVHLYRYEVQKNYDTWMPAVTFYVTSPIDVRGVANLEPRVIRHGKKDRDPTPGEHP